MDCPQKESSRCGELTRLWRFDCTEIRATMRQLFCRKFRVNKSEPLIYWTTIAKLSICRFWGSSYFGREEIRAPLKTAAWEATPPIM